MLLVKQYKYYHFAVTGRKIIQQLLPNHTFKIELNPVNKDTWQLICGDVDFTPDEMLIIKKFRRKK